MAEAAKLFTHLSLKDANLLCVQLFKFYGIIVCVPIELIPHPQEFF
jgi:hypothetical protein